MKKVQEAEVLANKIDNLKKRILAPKTFNLGNATFFEKTMPLSINHRKTCSAVGVTSP